MRYRRWSYFQKRGTNPHTPRMSLKAHRVGFIKSDIRGTASTSRMVEYFNWNSALLSHSRGFTSYFAYRFNFFFVLQLFRGFHICVQLGSCCIAVIWLLTVTFYLHMDTFSNINTVRVVDSRHLIPSISNSNWLYGFMLSPLFNHLIGEKLNTQTKRYF